jgi:hypothetical protein
MFLQVCFRICIIFADNIFKSENNDDTGVLLNCKRVLETHLPKIMKRGCFKKISLIRLLETRFKARNCIREPGPLRPYTRPF